MRITRRIGLSLLVLALLPAWSGPSCAPKTSLNPISEEATLDGELLGPWTGLQTEHAGGAQAHSLYHLYIAETVNGAEAFVVIQPVGSAARDGNNPPQSFGIAMLETAQIGLDKFATIRIKVGSAGAGKWENNFIVRYRITGGHTLEIWNMPGFRDLPDGLRNEDGKITMSTRELREYLEMHDPNDLFPERFGIFWRRDEVSPRGAGEAP